MSRPPPVMAPSSVWVKPYCSAHWPRMPPRIEKPTPEAAFSDLASIVQEEATDCVVEYAGSGDPDPRSYRVDFTKFATAFPGFTYAWNARKGARELLDAYAAANLTLADFEGHRFIRLKQLARLQSAGALDGDLRWHDA